jgi:translation initiation factor IF-2
MSNKSEKNGNGIADESERQKLAGNQIILAPMSVADIAQKAHMPVSEIILTLLKQGIMSTRNQVLPEKIVAQLAHLYGLQVVEKQKIQTQPSHAKESIITQEGIWKERLPIVVVIGHVDHGKTTLLDFIRKTRVAAKEKGGITQHLGAYEAHTSHGDIVFLDTPGHEAFSMMRLRGIKVADVAILVVAADDGVMPQTIEAINHAQSVGLPIIVAINKIDKANEQQIERVKKQLAQHGLVPEDWGGQTVCIPISAKLGTHADELLDVIILQSKLMDLKANLSIPARGYILESKLEKGRGPVATVICQHGILKVGDYFVAGMTSGKVSSLVNSYGKRVTQVTPSTPVQVAGFSELPDAGDMFEVVTQDIAKKGAVTQPPVARSDMMFKKASGETAINIIIKTDNASSKEALLASLDKLSSKVEREFHVIHAAIGDISESDVLLATDTHALIYGFHVKTQPNALHAISHYGIVTKHFDIIYKLLEDLEAIAQVGKPIKMVSKKIGEAVVLKVFDIKNLGIVAGAVVKSGRFVRDGKVVVWRGKHKVGEGHIKGLQRERKAVKEVHAGFECGFLVDDFDAWQVDDRVECYQDVPVS